ncbi:MAG: N-acetylornithine carbamoyltransferase [Luteibaculum sp.]
MKNFTSIFDITHPKALLESALIHKSAPLAHRNIGEGKTLGLIFLNPSLRTRMSTQKAAQNLGLHTLVVNLNNEGWALETEEGVVMNQGTQEHIKEAAGVISQYCDIIGLRTFPGLQSYEADYSEHVLNAFLKYVSVPVISLESATEHPLQSLADWITISEHAKRSRPKVVLSWAPHPKVLPQAVANSFVAWMKHADVDLCIANPQGYDLDAKFTQGISLYHNQDEALKNADFVYAKNWSTVVPYAKNLGGNEDWQITPEKMALCRDAYFMHCLPVRRNVVVSDAVLDSEKSLVLKQAENRIYSAQAVLHNLLQAQELSIKTPEKVLHL